MNPSKQLIRKLEKLGVHDSLDQAACCSYIIGYIQCAIDHVEAKNMSEARAIVHEAEEKSVKELQA
jgi:hypothetical protein